MHAALLGSCFKMGRVKSSMQVPTTTAQDMANLSPEHTSVLIAQVRSKLNLSGLVRTGAQCTLPSPRGVWGPCSYTACISHAFGAPHVSSSAYQNGSLEALVFQA